MILSLSEFSNLCRVAAKGAGFSWGQAQDVAGACKWLAAQGLWTKGHVDAVFELSDGNPFIVGMQLIDGLDEIPNEGVQLENIHHPVVLLPFLALMEQACDVRWNEGQFVLSRDGGCAGSGQDVVGAVDISISANSVDVIGSESNSRIDLAQEDWDALQGLASKTYAPATEESRRLGAG